MIREIIERSYKKTMGAAWSWLSRSTSSLANRIGVVQLVYILVAAGLMAGFVNAVVLPVTGSAAADPVYPATGAQTIPETFIDAMVILLGGAGIYLTYVSGRQTTKSRMVNLYLAVALLLVSLSVMMGLYLITAKGG
jgi:hypothetical protein